jgi:hypothetical protein
MVLPSSGPIDLNSIQTEFEGINPIGIDEYYRSGTYVPNNNNSIPIDESTDFYFHPPISFSNFYNTSSECVIIISVTTTNVNLQTLFDTTYPGSWAANFRKRLVINSEVIVGSTNPLGYALNIPSGFGRTVTIDNFGFIYGAGGAANSGTGGSAIFAGASGISINNQGTIYAGGGGGGRGGQGADGAVATGRTGQTIIGTIGGPGGSGGLGQGYNQINTTGAAGGASPSLGGAVLFAASGGKGGTGGTWAAVGATGTKGANGSQAQAGGRPSIATTGRPGLDGGLGGFYIVGNSNVTWIATGTRLGAVG